MKSVVAVIVLLCASAALVAADVYMHNPRGSNDRVREENTNRNNANRLFDSQNNAKGGYCWGPPMTFYEGSQLSIEWTNQHGCGSDKLQCNLVIQFMCSKADEDVHDRVRDGDGTTTDTIPEDDSTSTTFGLNENQTFYKNCEKRYRNFGLFIADREKQGGLTQNSRNRAINTRQNNDGTRHGYECPEERDYYPYWHPSPWMDVAILADNTNYCAWYKSHSENVMGRYQCAGKEQENTELGCTAAGGVWTKHESHGIDPPTCVKAPWTRENHLGNANGGYTAQHNWTISGISGAKQMACLDSGNCQCVLRLRYNISQAEAGTSNPATGFLDSNSNGAKSPVKTDPNVMVDNQNLTLAVDTTQFGRTFQDRSFVFQIKKRPSNMAPLSRIYNLNVRGKRGNIVETYPATEYDFAPSFVTARVGDYIHFQWTGCDNNPAGNAGEGRAKTDRSNIVQIPNFNTALPANDNWLNDNNALFPNKALRQRMAYAGADASKCPTYQQLLDRNNNDKNQVNQDGDNCMVLNAAPQYFDGGLQIMNNTGSYRFISSRNNNFSNRDQRGYILIAELLPAWAIALVVVGAAVFVAAAGVAGAMVYSRYHPHSAVAQYLNKI